MNAALDRLLRGFAWLLCKLFHDIRIEGAENVPPEGAVIIASNHPSYFDPVYILVGLERVVRFLGWEKPFKIPVLGWLIRRFGAIPLNIERPGRASIEAAVRVLRKGEAFGIFPEGGRSDFGTMGPLKSGVARLAMMTGAPIVPVTIRGAFKVWPKHRLFPRPGYVVVVFHPPIRLDPARLDSRHGGSSEAGTRDREYEAEIVERVMEGVNSALLPSLRFERREEELYEKAVVPWTWTSDAVPIFAFIAITLLTYSSDAAPSPAVLLPFALYIVYLALDSMWPLPGAWAKGMRARAPWLLLLLLLLTEAGFAAAGAGAAAYLALAWFQSFRFQDYRRVRAALLIAVWGVWLGWTFSAWDKLSPYP